MYYLDLFIYHLPDLWLEASQEQEKNPKRTYMECSILIKWIYSILEFIFQFIFSPD